MMRLLEPRWLEPQWFHLLWAVPVLAVILLASAARTRGAVKRFFLFGAGAPWAPMPSRAAQIIRLCLVLLALVGVTVALARPAFDPTPRQVNRVGRDVVFVVDVSRSMLAQDLRPSRLERAKLAIFDAIESVRGDRVGLVAFAGAAVQKSPLTTDLPFTRLALRDLSPDSVTRGGTAIGDAIRTATAMLFPDDARAAAAPSDGRSRDIFILTDGEDHESEPVEAAKEAAKRGIRIITIGLGSDLAGAPVPAPSPEVTRNSQGRVQPNRTVGSPGFVEYGGQRVASKMNPQTLRDIAEATPGGHFLNVGTGNIELDKVYTRLMRDAAKQNFESTQTMTFTEAFQWALLASLLCLLIEPLVRVYAA